MRIIAGRAKGRRLHSPPGSVTRPMTDRAREGLFSSLGTAVEGARVLDLFAGSGTLGLEALSRGAATVRFVERSRQIADVLRRNVETVGLGGEVVMADVASYLSGAPAPMDLVFVDPPYALATSEVEHVLELLEPWLAAHAIVVLHRRSGDPAPQTNLEVDDDRFYGGTHLIRYRRDIG